MEERQKGFSTVPSRPTDDLFNHHFLCSRSERVETRENDSNIGAAQSALMNAKRSENLTLWTRCLQGAVRQ